MSQYIVKESIHFKDVNTALGYNNYIQASHKCLFFHIITHGWILSRHPQCICEPNIKATKYTKQILTDLKGQTDNNTTILSDSYIPLSTIDRFSR